MVKMVRSELMKMRHTFSIKMVIVFPTVTLLIGYLLSGNSVQLAAYNWWYMIMLPITISIWCASMIVSERNTGYQNIMCLGTSLKRIYLAKVFAVAILLLTSNLVMWGGCTVLGFLTVMNISPWDGLCGSILLFLAYLWQIPLIMLLAKWIGYLPAVLVSFGFNIVLSLIGTEKSWFIFNPYAIPARIVCPFFRMHPNGLTLEEGSYLLETGMVLPAVGINLLFGVLLLLLTMKLFTKGE